MEGDKRIEVKKVYVLRASFFGLMYGAIIGVLIGILLFIGALFAIELTSDLINDLNSVGSAIPIFPNIPVPDSSIAFLAFPISIGAFTVIGFVFTLVGSLLYNLASLIGIRIHLKVSERNEEKSVFKTK